MTFRHFKPLFFCVLLLCSHVCSFRTSTDDVDIISINKGLINIPECTNTTRSMVISDNFISEIKEDALENCLNIISMTLARNNIYTADDVRGLSAAIKLEHLDLSENNLSVFSFGIFRSNTNLKNVILDNNPNIQVYENIPSLPRLETIHAKNCSLKKLPWLDFTGLPKLKVIDISDNPITNISEKVIQSLPNSLELIVSRGLFAILKNRSDIKNKNITLSCVENINDCFSFVQQVVTSTVPPLTTLLKENQAGNISENEVLIERNQLTSKSSSISTEPDVTKIDQDVLLTDYQLEDKQNVGEQHTPNQNETVSVTNMAIIYYILCACAVVLCVIIIGLSCRYYDKIKKMAIHFSQRMKQNVNLPMHENKTENNETMPLNRAIINNNIKSTKK